MGVGRPERRRPGLPVQTGKGELLEPLNDIGHPTPQLRIARIEFTYVDVVLFKGQYAAGVFPFELQHLDCSYHLVRVAGQQFGRRLPPDPPTPLGVGLMDLT